MCGAPRADGGICNGVHDGRGIHALSCSCGGSTTKRHDAIAEVVGAWLGAHSGFPVATEQYLADFRGPENELGRMDVVGCRQDGSPEFIDVRVASPVSTDPGRLARAALIDGVMAAEHERDKLRRYPHAANLVPFVIETGGRIGTLARAFARRHAPKEPEMRSRAISCLWHDVSAVCQRHNALMCLRSSKC